MDRFYLLVLRGVEGRFEESKGAIAITNGTVDRDEFETVKQLLASAASYAESANRQTDRNALLIEDNTRSIAELRQGITELREAQDRTQQQIVVLSERQDRTQQEFTAMQSQMVVMQQEVIEIRRDMRDMQTDIRGLQQENRRILDVLLNNEG